MEAAMMISDAAIVFWDDTRGRLAQRFGRRFRRPRSVVVEQYAAIEGPGVGAEPAPGEADVRETVDSVPGRTDMHSDKGQATQDWGAREIVLTVEERRARAVALRGLSQCRGHRFEAARGSFVEAAELDPAIDFAKLPDFWRLPQEAHQAAIEAYEIVGRTRDAAALTAAVRTAFRPKLLRLRPMTREPLPES
jgi:hypothetical protein